MPRMTGMGRGRFIPLYSRRLGRCQTIGGAMRIAKANVAEPKPAQRTG